MIGGLKLFIDLCISINDTYVIFMKFARVILQ